MYSKISKYYFWNIESTIWQVAGLHFAMLVIVLQLGKPRLDTLGIPWETGNHQPGPQVSMYLTGGQIRLANR